MRSPTTRSAVPAESTDGEKPAEDGWSTTRFILTLAILAWVIRSLIIAPFSIPSGSMIPTLYIGDYVAVAKWPYGYSRFSFPFGFPPIDGRLLGRSPSRGDVVVFRHPDQPIDLIKRVVGVAGDVVEVRGGELLLNGRKVNREPLGQYPLPVSANTPCKIVPPALPSVVTRSGQPYCMIPAFRERLPGGPSFTVLDEVPEGAADDFAPVRVPAGHLFLMGDNRDDSLDSRFGTEAGGIGLVPVENVIGRALVTFWSTDGSASYVKPWTWFTALRGSRIGNGYAGPAE
jgi:signal peptidase I